MMANPLLNPHDEGGDLAPLRAEIAALAARMIAQDGADYAGAKRKAARQVLGEARANGQRDALPDDLQVEEAVRQYHALFNADTQPARLRHLRATALDVMEKLAEYSPYLTGAVLNGSAGAHDDIRLQVFADSAKEVQIYLLNHNVDIDISESDHYRGPRFDPVETVSFLWHGEGVHVELYELNDLRGARKQKSGDRPARIDIGELRALLDE
ncbi:hypothetical protein IP91_02958 [Pseudoduganella lurida]|uniref:UDP-N-acetylmuramate--alanine ligase n=1 Tax=Pseudoduganella lurida TaxID=1036180 RepID=A0A562R524_9BURK|nr:hypothetical protein [Pseudoduganella lurida]TWI64192.1 hypothetical protein IP91_02958 [Pseudoduganella lurida]